MKRIRINALNDLKESASVSYSPLPLDFKLIRVVINCTCSLLGPLLIYPSTSHSVIKSINELTPIKIADGDEAALKNKIFLTPRLLMASRGQRSLLGSATFSENSSTPFTPDTFPLSQSKSVK